MIYDPEIEERGRRELSAALDRAVEHASAVCCEAHDNSLTCFHRNLSKKYQPKKNSREEEESK